MSFSAARVAEHGGEVEDARGMPAEVSWEMLDKSRFFLLGAALFSGVSAALYPAVVLKTHLQVAAPPQAAASAAAAAILRRDGPRGFYRGFGASLAGTVPARALYMAALEATKSAVGSAALRLGVAEPAASAAASAAGGVSAAVAAQVVWTPVDVVSQRLMVQTAPVAAAHYIRVPETALGQGRLPLTLRSELGLKVYPWECEWIILVHVQSPNAYTLL